MSKQERKWQKRVEQLKEYKSQSCTKNKEKFWDGGPVVDQFPVLFPVVLISLLLFVLSRKSIF